MRVRIVSIVAGVAGMASLGVPALAPAAPHLSLGSDKRIVVYKQHAQLSGRLTNGKRGVEVALKADRFPFGESATVATTRSGNSGRFGFHVNPILDTNYRVVLKKSPGVHSPLQRVFVVPRVNQSCNLCAGNGASPGGHTLKVKAKILYPTKAVARAETGKRAFFYYAQNNGHNGDSAGRTG